jgi:hypothetical protein
MQGPPTEADCVQHEQDGRTAMAMLFELCGRGEVTTILESHDAGVPYEAQYDARADALADEFLRSVDPNRPILPCACCGSCGFDGIAATLRFDDPLLAPLAAQQAHVDQHLSLLQQYGPVRNIVFPDASRNEHFRPLNLCIAACDLGQRLAPICPMCYDALQHDDIPRCAVAVWDMGILPACFERLSLLEKQLLCMARPQCKIVKLSAVPGTSSGQRYILRGHCVHIPTETVVTLAPRLQVLARADGLAEPAVGSQDSDEPISVVYVGSQSEWAALCRRKNADGTAFISSLLRDVVQARPLVLRQCFQFLQHANVHFRSLTHAYAFLSDEELAAMSADIIANARVCSSHDAVQMERFVGADVAQQRAAVTSDVLPAQADPADDEDDGDEVAPGVFVRDVTDPASTTTAADAAYPTPTTSNASYTTNEVLAASFRMDDCAVLSAVSTHAPTSAMVTAAFETAYPDVWPARPDECDGVVDVDNTPVCVPAPAGVAPLNDYTQGAEALLKSYPTVRPVCSTPAFCSMLDLSLCVQLFPLGELPFIGLAPREWKRKVMLDCDRRCANDKSFIFSVFDAQRRADVCRVVSASVDADPVRAAGLLALLESPGFYTRIKAAKAAPHTEDARALSAQLQPFLSVASAKVPYTSAARQEVVKFVSGMSLMFGLPSVWGTIAPVAESAAVVIKVATGQFDRLSPDGSPSASAAFVLPDRTARGMAVSADPAAAAEWYQRLIDGVFNVLYRVLPASAKRVQPPRTCAARTPGLLGFTLCACGVCEEQVSLSFHNSMFVCVTPVCLSFHPMA